MGRVLGAPPLAEELLSTAGWLDLLESSRTCVQTASPSELRGF
ncbi:rCG29847 [Rattus norvegicus]|uniref:RCG29847 n=1 Tax=Rattus norvegicus TaxID=10116 RepID=A6IMX6_RAT|nr:rCG29847 [Rattus norvegicus]